MKQCKNEPMSQQRVATIDKFRRNTEKASITINKMWDNCDIHVKNRNKNYK